MSAEKMVKCEHTGIAFDAITIDPKLTIKLGFSNNLDQKPQCSSWERGVWHIQDSAQYQQTCSHPHTNPDLWDHVHMGLPSLLCHKVL